MSQPVYDVLPDGTRVYRNGGRYKPVPDEERVNQRRKPDHPRAVRHHDAWFILPELLPDDVRVMPLTDDGTRRTSTPKKWRRKKGRPAEFR